VNNPQAAKAQSENITRSMVGTSECPIPNIPFTTSSSSSIDK